MKKTERKLTGTYWKDTCHYYKFLNEETFLQVYYHLSSNEIPDFRIATSSYNLFNDGDYLVIESNEKEFNHAMEIILDTIIKLL